MTNSIPIEQQIQDIISQETEAVSISNKLFGPDGLFNRLARTPDERRAVSRSELFGRAQRRFLELQQKEASAFARAIDDARDILAPATTLVKLEQS